MNELLPCPFCAGSAEFRTSTSGTQQWIRCVNPECDAFGPFARTQAEAVAKWNDRAGLDTAQAQALLVGEEIATLQAEVARLRAALEAVEWACEGYDHDEIGFCPWCGWRENAHRHRADCQRQLALGLTP
jgi:hypothetical protein